MTEDLDVQTYLINHPQGDAVEWRHLFDPLDTDGGPLQRLADGPGAPHTETTPQTAQDAA